MLLFNKMLSKDNFTRLLCEKWKWPLCELHYRILCIWMY